GKLGGREMSYHSDLDLVLIYEGQRETSPSTLGTSTDTALYFTELMQRIIRSMSLLGPLGRLYQVDMRLRPAGRSGILVTPLSEFKRYHNEGEAQLWERQILTRARIVHGEGAFADEVMAAVHKAAFGPAWKPEFANEIVKMRERLEASRSRRDVKRGFGGQV